MKQASSILVSGALAYDYIFLYSGKIRDHLPSNSESSLYLNLRARGPFRMWGGCGGNVAYNLALLGAPTRLTSWVGKDVKEYLKRLQDLGIDTSEVFIQNEFLTPTGILLVDSQEDQILFFGEAESPISWPLPSMAGVELLVVTAGIPSRAIEIMQASRSAGIPFVVDPGKFIMDISPELLVKSIEGADSLVFNEYERDLLVRRTGHSWTEILSMITVSVTTMGSEGAVVEVSFERERIPAVKPVKVVDPNGAGDAFLGGYSFGRFRGFSPEWSVRIGAVAASFAIEAKGAQGHQFTLKAFEKRLRENYGELEQPLIPPIWEQGSQ